MSSPKHRKIESADEVTYYRAESDVICGFYLSMLRRRHFPYIGAHRE